ncbi:protein kinase [bacterium]|nr:protein kinase [bacterium]
MKSFDSSLDEFAGKDVADRYRCLMRLGSGGMGVVYLAEDSISQKNVILKALKPPALAKERIFREANILSQLNHPHIVTIFDFGVWQEITYIVMEYLEGEDLKQILTKAGALSTERIMDILAEIMEALEVAHNAGIIHRDLKPANIFCVMKPGQDEYIKILDFGLAKSFIHQEDSLIDSEITGTPHYMSPEQILGRTLISVQSDIYSLGVILYEMLTGVVPMTGETTMAIFLEHIYKPAPRFDKASCKHDPLRKRLQEVSLTCLQKDPADRYDSIRSLRLAINSILPLKGWPEKLQLCHHSRIKPNQKRSRNYSAATRELSTYRNLSFVVLEDTDLPVDYAITPMLKMLHYRIESYPFRSWRKFKQLDYPHIIILNSGENNNLTIISALQNTEHWNTIPIVVCGPADDQDYMDRALEAGASEYLAYPFDPRELPLKLENIVT